MQTLWFSEEQREVQHLPPVLWKTGKLQHDPGNSYRHISHCSSAKGAESLGMAYLAINPTHWIKLLGTRSLHVCVFLYGSVSWDRSCALWRSCPSCLPLMQGGQADFSRSRGAGVWPLRLSTGCDLGCQGDGFQKAKSALGFQRLSCFFWSANQEERQIQDTGFFVLFCFVSVLQSEWSWQPNLLG